MTTADLIQDIQHHRELCHEALALFASPTSGTELDLAARKTLPARLDLSLNSLRRWRQWWRDLPTAERQAHPEVATLLQDTLDLMMKSIVQGREAFERKLPEPTAPAAPTTPPAPPVREMSKPNFARVEPTPKTAHFVARRYTKHAD